MEGGKERRRSDPHPLLRGSGSSRIAVQGRHCCYSHGFSPSMMQSLSAVCEALVPSLPAPVVGGEELPSKSVQAFYSANPVPDEVGGFKNQRLLSRRRERERC